MSNTGIAPTNAQVAGCMYNDFVRFCIEVRPMDRLGKHGATVSPCHKIEDNMKNM